MCVLLSSFVPLFDPVAILLVVKHSAKSVATSAVWVSLNMFSRPESRAK